MHSKELKPRKALNKAYLKVKPTRADIERFKSNLIHLIDYTNYSESEEFHKNLISDFLKNTWYAPQHFINTKGRNDLVIHNGPKADNTVGVIIETKSPLNRSEMVTRERLNTKAFHELVLYYLRERITLRNMEVKHLVITNIFEWYIFDVSVFEKNFAQNKSFVQQFTDFESGRLADIRTDFFYKQIAEPFIANLQAEIEYTWFDLHAYQKILRNANKEDDHTLIALFKLLSPEHLLKLPFSNDSNSLDKRFYTELLHIIGLTETKEGGKKLIGRNKEGARNPGSILENAMTQLDSVDKIYRLEKPGQFGDTQAGRLFNVALELSITWINRILFLKLLEAQLISYHRGDSSYSFLSFERIENYDALNRLFFQVLARKYEDRSQELDEPFAKVPYLNSSLFEPTDLEHSTLFISNLMDNTMLPILRDTVLKDVQGRKRTGNLTTLQYLLEFLNSYDFTSEGSEEIQEENKTLINASVLGLIFEKINGYKDGSFFTPGFITMYMCRETIRKAVVQKFNDTKNWSCKTLEEVYDKIEDRNEANAIVNSVKICDPAVGSGHFLVSALNEMIAIKSDLKILQDRSGWRLKEYHIEVVNDELIVTDEEGRLFEYLPAFTSAGISPGESQRVQETLFHEKQTIIENCLFGVDINANSVKICRLRLWIELLKNAYYKTAAGLETLPNIDINIKQGNSLVSRFAIDADLKQALKKSKWTIDSYRLAVATYRNAESKEQKREMENLILSIKQSFTSEIRMNDPIKKRHDKLAAELYHRFTGTFLFDPESGYNKEEKKQEKKRKQEQKKLEEEVEILAGKMDEIKNNKIYDNAFEWRFEFPEVLDDEGNFIGFDVVIGNPPYVNFRDIKNIEEKNYYLNKYVIAEYQTDLFILFIEKAFNILKLNGEFGFIVPNSVTNNLNNSLVRKFILENSTIRSIVNTPIGVFPDATVDTVVILSTISNEENSNLNVLEIDNQNIIKKGVIEQKTFYENEKYYLDFLNTKENRALLRRIEVGCKLLNEISDSSSGIKEYETGKGNPQQTKNDRERKIFNSNDKIDERYRKHLQGNDVNNYVINWKGGFLKYGSWLAAPRESKYFEGERIIIREIPGKTRLIAAFTKENYTVKNTAHIFKINSEYETKYVLAILNSKLMGYYFMNKFSERDNVFPKAKIGQCRLLPIKMIDAEKQQTFKMKVEEIMFMKNEGKDTAFLESKIDQLVYQLYELTEVEIGIVEGGEK